jgi:type I restriction enzyme S subunit
MTSAHGLVRQDSYFKKTIASRDTSSYKVVRPGQVVVGIHVDEGAIGVSKAGHHGIVSPAYTLWDIDHGGRVDFDFLDRFLRSPQSRAYFIANYRQTAERRGKLTRDRFLALEVPLPSLEEQRRIASILDAADVLRTKRRQALEKLDSLTQSIFIDMFGDPIRNDRGWHMRSLDSAAVGIFDCPHSTPKWSEEGRICLRTSNLGRGTWDWTDKRFVSDATFTERSRRAQLEPGDIILSREGTVGIAAIVPPETPMCMGQRLVQVRVNQGIVLPRFLLEVLLYILEPNRISRVMAGSTSKHLNVKELRALRIPVPPLELQHAYENAAESSAATLNVMSIANSSVEALFASLQHRAFRGEL